MLVMKVLSARNETPDWSELTTKILKNVNFDLYTRGTYFISYKRINSQTYRINDLWKYQLLRKVIKAEYLTLEQRITSNKLSRVSLNSFELCLSDCNSFFLIQLRTLRGCFDETNISCILVFHQLLSRLNVNQHFVD